MKPPAPEPHYRHRFTAEIIGHAVWPYHVFSRSLRDVDLLLAERGIVVCYETVRRWCKKPSPQPNQRTGITDAQPSGLHPQQHVKAAELLLAHRHHRHGAPPATPEPARVSPLLCRGVSFVYCGYEQKPHKAPLWKAPRHPNNTSFSNDIKLPRRVFSQSSPHPVVRQPDALPPTPRQPSAAVPRCSLAPADARSHAAASCPAPASSPAARAPPCRCNMSE